MLDYVKGKLPEIQAVVIADYAKGVVSPELVQGVVALCANRGKNPVPVLVDPKMLDFSAYRGVDVIKPNHKEAAQAARVIINNNEDLRMAAEQLLQDVQCNAVLVTRGEEGMSLFEKGKKYTHIPTVARQVYDVSGAGDTVMAVLAICLAIKDDLVSAAYMSNFAAGVVVGKVGVSTVTRDELRVAIQKGRL